VKLSSKLIYLKNKWRGRSITVKELIESMGERSPIFFCLILSIPFLLFIPLPGLSTLFGAMIIFCGGALFLHRPLWLPSFFLRRTIGAVHLQKILKGATWLSEKIECLLRERWKGFYNSLWKRRILGICIAICGFLLALPLPPGTNFPPALTLACFALGVLMGDGVGICLGYCLLLINLFLYLVLPFLIVF
jgi:hypothetical protein